MGKIIAKTEWKKGFIILLDFLGVRNLDIDATDDFIMDIEKMIRQINSLKGYIEFSKSENKCTTKLDSKKYISDTEIFLFGDTVLITCSSEEIDSENNEFSNRLISISAFLALWLKYGIEEKRLRFRGSLSFGDYCVSQRNVVLGPAVVDAATWHERAKWIGVMMTPKFSVICDKTFQSDSTFNFSGPLQWFLKTDIPVKNGLIKDIWVINWPQQFFHDVISENTKELLNKSTNEFLSLIDIENVPVNCADIFTNTIAFYNLSKSKVEQLHEQYKR